MRISFVAIGWEQLSLSLLSAIAKKEGHQVSLAYSPSLFNDRYNLSIPFLAYIFNDQKYIINILLNQKPDVIAFSALTSTYEWMTEIAREIKLLLPDVIIIFGGVHPSAVPDNVIRVPYIDYICIGEGDVSFPLILRNISNGKHAMPVPNVWSKNNKGQIIKGQRLGFIQDLDSLPIFDKSIWEDYIRIGDLYFTMASRGCPYQCTFCFNSFFSKLAADKSGKYVRHRSVDHMMHELRIAKKYYKLRMIDFEDDIFTFNKAWLKDFLWQYKKDIGVPFQCLSHPRFIDEEVVKWLADSGCEYIQMGIQTMDDQYKAEVINRYEKTEHVEKAIDLMKKYKIKAKIDHMFGLPQEPIIAQEKALDLYKEHIPYRIQTFWMNFLPGIEIIEKGISSGLIDQTDIDNINNGRECDFYRKSNKISDIKKYRIYKKYELIFKLLPLLPYKIRKKMHIEYFRYIPAIVCSFFTFILDACRGLITKNPDHIGYANYYIHHIWSSLIRNIGLKQPSATKTDSKREISDYDFISKEEIYSQQKDKEVIGSSKIY